MSTEPTQTLKPVAYLYESEDGSKELIRELVEALRAALPRLAHKASCHTTRPASEWLEHGSASFENCNCEIATVRAALEKVGLSKESIR
jgi:hypothetical protein